MQAAELQERRSCPWAGEQKVLHWREESGNASKRALRSHSTLYMRGNVSWRENLCVRHTMYNLSGLNQTPRRPAVRARRSPAVIMRRDERHRSEHRFPLLAAHVDRELCALLVEAVLDVAHRDVLAQRRRRDSRRHHTWFRWRACQHACATLEKICTYRSAPYSLDRGSSHPL